MPPPSPKEGSGPFLPPFVIADSRDFSCISYLTLLLIPPSCYRREQPTAKLTHATACFPLSLSSSVAAGLFKQPPPAISTRSSTSASKLARRFSSKMLGRRSLEENKQNKGNGKISRRPRRRRIKTVPNVPYTTDGSAGQKGPRVRVK